MLKGCSFILIRGTPSYLWGTLLHTYEGPSFILIRCPSYFWGALLHTFEEHSFIFLRGAPSYLSDVHHQAYEGHFILMRGTSYLMRGTSYLWGALHILWGTLHNYEGHFIYYEGHFIILMRGTHSYLWVAPHQRCWALNPTLDWGRLWGWEAPSHLKISPARLDLLNLVGVQNSQNC